MSDPAYSVSAPSAAGDPAEASVAEAVSAEPEASASVSNRAPALVLVLVSKAHYHQSVYTVYLLSLARTRSPIQAK